MDCNVIRDLIPLYIDDCCSKESKVLVEEHLKTCAACNAIYENMKVPSAASIAEVPNVKMKRINDWKASILQSVLLFVSFGIITIGVALEAATSSDGLLNGYHAINTVVPATGFLLSLVNWYFVRLYKDRKSFSDWSCILTLGITVMAYIWSGMHYEFDLSEMLTLFKNISAEDFAELILGFGFVFGRGVLFSGVCVALSKILSDIYAKMLGKE